MQALLSSRISKGGSYDPSRVHHCDGAVIVGSSGVGKSFLVSALRNSNLAQEGVLAFPVRLITRRARMNDDINENRHVSWEHFEMVKAAELLSVYWPRHLVAHHQEQYGFHRHEEGSFPIFSANNALLRCRQRQVTEFLRRKVIIGVYASDAVREKRLRNRSPDLFVERHEEVENRLVDSSSSIPPIVDFVVNTDPRDGPEFEDPRAEFLRLIRGLVHLPSTLV